MVLQKKRKVYHRIEQITFKKEVSHLILDKIKIVKLFLQKDFCTKKRESSWHKKRIGKIEDFLPKHGPASLDHGPDEDGIPLAGEGVELESAGLHQDVDHVRRIHERLQTDLAAGRVGLAGVVDNA